MNPQPNSSHRRRLFLAATYLGTMACCTTVRAQTAPSMTVLPLEQSASRGIVTRDPSSIVKCKDEYWVFYTGRGVPSYHSADLVTWVRGPAVFKTAPDWIAGIVPENRRLSYWAPDIM